jgi:Mor family transcriptional regulator
MNYLSLKIGQVDLIGIYNADGADAGRRKVQPRRSAKSACAYYEYFRGKEFFLALPANFFQDDMPTVPFDLLFS